MSDSEYWVKVEIRRAYRAPAQSMEEQFAREREQAILDVKADEFAKEMEKRMNREHNKQLIA